MKKVTKKKKVTLEDIGNKMDRGFAGVALRFNGVDTKIAGLDTKIDKLATATQKEFLGINERFDAHEKKADELHAEIKNIREKLNNIVYRHEFEAIKARVDVLEKRYLRTNKH